MIGHYAPPSTLEQVQYLESLVDHGYCMYYLLTARLGHLESVERTPLLLCKMWETPILHTGCAGLSLALKCLLLSHAIEFFYEVLRLLRASLRLERLSKGVQGLFIAPVVFVENVSAYIAASGMNGGGGGGYARVLTCTVGECRGTAANPQNSLRHHSLVVGLPSSTLPYESEKNPPLEASPFEEGLGEFQVGFVAQVAAWTTA